MGSGRVLSQHEVDDVAWPDGLAAALRRAEDGEADPPRAAFPWACVGLDGTSRVLTCPSGVVDERALMVIGAVRELGATNLVLERFDPEAALVAIEQHRITHSQWSQPMLEAAAGIDPAVRRRYDLSSHVAALYCGSCPVSVEKELTRWWGPILHRW